MKLQSVLLAMFSLLPLTLYAENSRITVHVAECSQQGPRLQCKLAATDKISFDKTHGKFKAKNVFLRMSPKVSGELRLYRKDKKQDEVGGEFLLDNFSKEKAYFQYHVIFKDKQGKVAQTKGDIHLLPGKRQKIPFSTIRLREEDIRNINAYQVKMTLSNQENKPHK